MIECVLFISKNWGEYLSQCEKNLPCLVAFQMASLALPGMSSFVVELVVFFGLVITNRLVILSLLNDRCLLGFMASILILSSN